MTDGTGDIKEIRFKINSKYSTENSIFFGTTLGTLVLKK